MSITTDGKIEAPISAWEPYKVLGVGARSNGYEVNYICSNLHGKINKWAKYKPVKHNNKYRLTEAELKSINYGLTAPDLQSYDWPDMAANDFQLMREAVWTYEAPGNGWAKRLTDFVAPADAPAGGLPGYNHNAVPPVMVSVPASYISSQNPNVTIRLGGEGGKADFSIAEFSYLSQYYPTVIMRPRNGSSWYIITYDQTFGQISATSDDTIMVRIPYVGFLQSTNIGGDWEIVVAATDEKRTQPTQFTPDTGSFVLLPVDDFDDVHGVMVYVEPVYVEDADVWGVNNMAAWAEEDEKTIYPGSRFTLQNPMWFTAGNGHLQVAFTFVALKKTIFQWEALTVEIEPSVPDILVEAGERPTPVLYETSGPSGDAGDDTVTIRNTIITGPGHYFDSDSYRGQAYPKTFYFVMDLGEVLDANAIPTTAATELLIDLKLNGRSLLGDPLYLPIRRR